MRETRTAQVWRLSQGSVEFARYTSRDPHLNRRGPGDGTNL